MRVTPVLVAAVLVAGLGACSKKPTPAVTPVPETPPPPPPPAPPPPPPPAPPAGPTCQEVITSTVNELAVRIHFETDKYELLPGDAGILDAKSETLRSHPAVRLRITGHADERYTDEYNLVLGTRRAEAAKAYLVRRGVDGSRLETASLGETQPIDPGHNEAAWDQNRRDEFEILAGRETLASHLARCR